VTVEIESDGSRTQSGGAKDPIKVSEVFFGGGQDMGFLLPIWKIGATLMVSISTATKRSRRQRRNGRPAPERGSSETSLRCVGLATLAVGSILCCLNNHVSDRQFLSQRKCGHR
jgi:hypothetical protein